MAERSGQLPHEDEQQFRAALTFTAAQTGFNPRLIEKDYFCSIILRELRPLFDSGLVFKGGTALSKVHAEFHRLSEDLDFMISITADATQGERRAAIKVAKDQLQEIVAKLAWLTEFNPLRGANKSSQYNGAFAYTSQISGEADTIKIEISLREQVLEDVEWRDAATILMEPLTEMRSLEPIPVVVLSREESYAEKIRAALSRREPAIRDLFDLYHAIGSGIIEVNSTAFLDLAIRKLRVNPDEPSNVSNERFESFRRQVETILRPVLRSEDFEGFDVEQMLTLLIELDQRLQPPL